MEQIIHTLSVLELIMLLPILLAGYRERKNIKMQKSCMNYQL